MKSNPDYRLVCPGWTEVTLRIPNVQLDLFNSFVASCFKGLHPPLARHVLDVLGDGSRLRSKYDLSKLVLFGSVATGLAKPSSDVDFYVEYLSPPGLRHFQLREELEVLLGRPVDLMTFYELKERFVDPAAQDRIAKESIHVW